jgi:hypothetical protein
VEETVAGTRTLRTASESGNPAQDANVVAEEKTRLLQPAVKGVMGLHVFMVAILVTVVCLWNYYVGLTIAIVATALWTVYLKNLLDKEEAKAQSRHLHGPPAQPRGRFQGAPKEMEGG